MRFTSSHRYHTAFLASHLEALGTLIVTQAERVLDQASIPIPSRTVSAVLVIAENGETTIAEIAEALRQPHQLVTQRIELLLKLGFIEKHPDPKDGRRKLLSLTPDGLSLHGKLEAFLANVTDAFADLFVEIECDLEEKLGQVSDLLAQKPLHRRLK